MDVSGHQTLAQVQAIAADPGQSLIIVKSSEGKDTASGAYAGQRDAAGAKFLGAYHFAWPNQDPALEVANYLTAATLRPGDLAMLDAEDWGTGPHPTPEMLATPWTQRLAYVLAWLDAVKAATGATPLIYLNWTWIKGLRSAATAEQWARLTAYPLWLAEPTGTPGQHSTVTSKDGSSEDSWPIVLHQYLVDSLDHDWTPDLAKLKALGATKEA